MASPIQLDALIIGGGIAGLWTLARLRFEGFRAVLLENTELGGGQTAWSQGIIHGGIKYALTGEASAASRAIAAMPEIWRACLEGRGIGDGAGVDLSSVKPLATQQHLWTTPGIASRIAGVAASKAIRTPVEKLPRERWPAALQPAPARGVDVYSVAEPVLPSHDAAQALARGHEHAIAGIAAVDSIQPLGTRAAVRARLTGGAPIAFDAAAVICVAGAGNEALASLAGMSDIARMQRRPLHMVMVRAPRDTLPPLFGHCLGASTVPRLTITTVEHAGGIVWYIGGGIAEDGVNLAHIDQITAARDELAACLPWIDLAPARWATGRIDRAEGLTADGKRPDEPVIHRRGPVMIAWPTKLAFAPALAGRVFQDMVQRPRGSGEPLPEFTPPPIATPPWAAVPAWSSLRH